MQIKVLCLFHIILKCCKKIWKIPALIASAEKTNQEIICIQEHRFVHLDIYINEYTYGQSWAVSPIQYLLRQKISIVDTFVFVFVSIINIKKVFVIVSISHK